MPHSGQNNNVLDKFNVVVALLDWGLGHTTRSIPIIRHLIANNCNVIVACNSDQKLILSNEIADLRFEPLDGYKIRYGKNAWLTALSIILQVPKILTKINRERKWLHRYVQQNRVDLVISDNRYGFVSSKVPSVFITHQLTIRTGLGATADRFINYLNRSYMGRFTDCWVPDIDSSPSIAGSLSRVPEGRLLNTKYLGALSRFEACASSSIKKKFILVILSGPEPQRTLLERLIISQAANTGEQLVLVRGLPTSKDVIATASNITCYNYLPAKKLNQMLCDCELVVSRSGYTSVMDYMKLGVRSILVPTPGQEEQRYLGQHLHRQAMAYSVAQKSFDFNVVLQNARTFPYQLHQKDMDSYKKVIDDLLQKLASTSRG